MTDSAEPMPTSANQNQGDLGKSLGIVGHEEILNRFDTTLNRGRLASTYLFVGPEGVGKRTTAIALAKSLLCTKPDAGHSGDQANQSHSLLIACGECDSCRLTDKGTHPDLFLLGKPSGKSSLPLSLFLGEPDQRNRSGLCHDISLKPMIGTRRIAIIDDADDFSVESANCLLKTLEEPPPGAVMFLIGTSLSKQLPTIRSRAQIVRFDYLKESEVSEVLLSLAFEDPDDTIDPAQVAELAQESNGSITRALAYRDAGLREARQAVDRSLSADPIDPLALATLIEEQTKSAGTEPSIRRGRFRELIHGMISFYREQMLTRGDERALTALDACFEAEAALGRNANQSALVQHLATQLWRIQTGKQ